MIHSDINIFLADDDEDDRELFRDAITETKRKFNLITVDSGDKVIDYFKNKNPLPNFVFLDINMPVKNGLECLKYIKELHPGNDFHVIMLSTSVADKDIKFSFTHGASVYIQKPGDFSHLVSYIDYCINELSFDRNQDDFILNHKFINKH